MRSSRAAVRHLCQDKKLAAAIRAAGPYKIRVTKGRFESLVGAIIAQQISGHAARSISRRFCAMYRPARFPSPASVAATSRPKLVSCGLSKMKASYISTLAKAVASGRLRLDRIARLPDEEVIAELVAMPGIGRWTAEMFLIFTLGRTDVFPAGDLGVKRGIQKIYGLKKEPGAAEMQRIAEKWRPYRTVATWYVWRSLEEK